MTARAAGVTFDVATRRGFAERGGQVVTVGFYLLVVAVMSSLWRSAAEAHGGSIAGYTAVALTWYLATSEAVTVSLNARLIEDIGVEIDDGTVATEMLRPVPVLVIRVAAEVGRTLPRLLACAVAGVGVAWLLGGAPPDLAALGLAAPAMVLAVSCNLVAMHAFAAAGFWLRDTRSAWFLYQKLVFLLGGMLIPLEVLPDAVQSVAWALPFMAMAYAPARLASGHVEPLLLLVQLGWLIVLGVATRAVFAAGERRLQAVGG
ncbi:MAG: viologen exporter family transport system permease protein [Actinomycetota bacterium]|jgi:ABC-2 type transport system permease protein|nr:viologen exporter family transport system permease protein [Actinomycetota bacterium]